MLWLLLLFAGLTAYYVIYQLTGSILITIAVVCVPVWMISILHAAVSDYLDRRRGRIQ